MNRRGINMIKTNTFTTNENIDLTAEISLVAPMDTPLTSFIMGKGQYESGLANVTTWREKTLDTTEDISFIEGSETDEFQATQRAEKSNTMQIFKKAVLVSGSAQASKIKGINDLVAEEVNDRLIEMKVQVEKALITGTRLDGSEAPFVRKMQGLLEFAPADNRTVGVFSEDTFKGTVRKLWDSGLGASEYICMVNADLKEEMDKWFADSYSYNAPMNEFGIVVHKINTNYGTVNLILNRHMPVDKAVIFDPKFVELSFLRKPFFEPLSKTGDNVKAQVITEVTLKVLNEKAVATMEIG